MALIIPSGLISRISGKVGGAIFQHSKAGIILRTNTMPVNKRTLLQVKTRNNTFNILQSWIRLTDSQRNVWSSYVQYNPILQKNGQRLYITGQQAFIKFNSYRLEYDLPILETPIFNKCAITPISLTCYIFINLLVIASDRPMVSADEFIILFLTTRFSSSINNPGSRYKIIKFTTTNTDVYVVSTPYVNIFGRTPKPGETIFMKYTNASKLSGLPFPFKFEKVLL